MKNMKKMTQLTMIIVVVALIVGMCYQYGGDVFGKALSGMNLTKPALKIKISTDVNESTNNLEVTNITIEQTSVSKMFRSVDTPAEFPNIDVEAKRNTIYSVPISYWASEKRTDVNGTYNFVLTFRDNQTANVGDLLILSVCMNDFRGNLEYKTTAFYEWK
jgi:hypothetical protein